MITKEGELKSQDSFLWLKRVLLPEKKIEWLFWLLHMHSGQLLQKEGELKIQDSFLWLKRELL